MTLIFMQFPTFAKMTLRLASCALALAAMAALQSCAHASQSATLQSLVKEDLAFFLQHHYKQDAWLARARNDTDIVALAQADAWLSSLQHPDVFLQDLWVNIADDVGDIASFKTSSGAPLTLSRCDSWQDCSAAFYSQGQSVVVRREHLGLPFTALEQELMTTFHLPSITAHAYVSAGSAQALKPHTDP